MERAPSAWRRLHGRIVAWTPQPWASGALVVIALLMLFEGATGFRLGGTRLTAAWTMGQAAVGAAVCVGLAAGLWALHRWRPR